MDLPEIQAAEVLTFASQKLIEEALDNPFVIIFVPMVQGQIVHRCELDGRMFFRQLGHERASNNALHNFCMAAGASLAMMSQLHTWLLTPWQRGAYFVFVSALP